MECSAPGGTDATDAGIAAFLNGANASDVCDASLTINNDAPGFFNLGTTSVIFDTADDSSNSSMCSADVSVVDTTPPTISNVEATPNVLWPPNHKMNAVLIDVTVTDICDPVAMCQIISVSSNEPINGAGDGNTNTDWEITGALSLNLRAERAGGGSGRIYTVGVQCGDGSGNTSDASVEVTVPHSKGKG